MASETKTKIHEAGGRHTLYLPSDLVKDSAFPFTPGKNGDALVVRIEEGRLVVEKAGGKRK